jgi:DNA-binding response OmpR family regulator
MDTFLTKLIALTSSTVQGASGIKKVLIVDDNPAILDIVSELVSGAGFDPLTASGGREALEKAASEHPDLVLLDINMPDMDGWTVLRKLKEGGITASTKVMMLTATTDVGTDIFGLQDVVSGYIRKPFNNKDLSDRLKAILDEKPAPAVVTPTKEEPRLFSLFGKKKGESDGKEKATRSAKKFELRPGLSYVVKEQKAVRSFEIFTDQVTHNIQGLCITRQYPAIVRQEWALEETPIIWLSNQLGKVYVNPANIGILGDTIIRFIEKSDDSVVMIDGIEFLIVNNGFDKVLKMIHRITEVVMEYKSRLIISVDPRALDVREMALLERNMEVIESDLRPPVKIAR